MKELLDKVPGWVWFVLPAVGAALAVLARTSKNKWDDWVVRIGVTVLETFLARNGVRVDIDGDGRIGHLTIEPPSSASSPGGSIQLDGPGIVDTKE